MIQSLERESVWELGHHNLYGIVSVCSPQNFLLKEWASIPQICAEDVLEYGDGEVGESLLLQCCVFLLLYGLGDLQVGLLQLPLKILRRPKVPIKYHKTLKSC